MKKFLPGLICLAGTACLYCCSSEYDIFENDVEQISDQFSVAEARAYFERTAEDLRGVTIGAGHTHAPVTKALPGADEVEGGPVLTPQWSKGRQTDDNGLAVSILRFKGLRCRPPCRKSGTVASRRPTCRPV